MQLRCPNCEHPIPASAMNVNTNVAVCAACSEAFELSALVAGGQDADISPDEAPRGAWFQTNYDSWQVGATTRTLGALLLVPFTLVWAGGSLGGIYGLQIVQGEFNLVMSLFGIPFLLGSLLLISMTLMAVAGRVTVTVADNEGVVFTGVGPLGWQRRFRWDEVERIEEGMPAYHYSGRFGAVISLVGKTRLKFAGGVSDARRWFMLQVLRKMLRGRRQNPNTGGSDAAARSRRTP